jgi:phosphoserine phosphatase RsbU/P
VDFALIIVSGDFYYLEHIKNLQEVFDNEPITEKVIIAAIDCTGHGVPGAFMSLIGNEVLNEIINSKKISQADQLLNLLHKGVQSALKQADNDNQDGMEVALCVIAKHINSPVYIQFAGAANSLYWIQNQQLTEIKGDKMPIGGSQYNPDRKFTAHNLPLKTTNATDKIQCYLCSDGFQDQFGGKEGRKFMIKKLKETFVNLSTLPMQSQATPLAHLFNEWKGTGKQIDDVLVIGFELAI